MKATKADVITFMVLIAPFVLTLLMLIIKMCGVNIPYWIVFAPIYPFAITLVIGLLYIPILKFRIWRSNKKVK